MEQILSAGARCISRTLPTEARVSHKLRARQFSLSSTQRSKRPNTISRSSLYHFECSRCISSSASLLANPPKSRYRGPVSKEDTQTDFGQLDVLRNTAVPATGIDACMSDGFALNNNMKISGCGILLVGGEVFRWRPWLREGRKEGTVAEGGVGDDALTGRLKNIKGQWEVPNEAWGILDLVWPKPDLLIIGTGPSLTPLSPATRQYINSLGIRLEVSDTGNAAAQFRLLATERGVEQVAAALIPIGWKEGR